MLFSVTVKAYIQTSVLHPVELAVIISVVAVETKHAVFAIYKAMQFIS